MSIYSELLAGLCADVEPLPLPVSKDELVVILLQSRRRMNEHGGEGDHIMTEDLALELDHDRMLLRLCTALGIETEPERFGNPLVERDRLEQRLRELGVDFRTLDDHRLAMTFAVAGLIASGSTTIDLAESAAVSYPGFFLELERLSA